MSKLMDRLIARVGPACITFQPPPTRCLGSVWQLDLGQGRSSTELRNFNRRGYDRSVLLQHLPWRFERAPTVRARLKRKLGIAWPPRSMERIVGLDHAAVADAVQEAHAVALQASGGTNATYIPFLANVPAQLCGVCAVTPDGKVFEAGDTRFDFAIESISKVFTLALAMEQCGPEVVHAKNWGAAYWPAI